VGVQTGVQTFKRSGVQAFGFDAEHRTPPRRGFTLVEVLVAAAVLAIGISAGVRTLGVMARASAAAADRETAVRLAEQRLATLEAIDGAAAGDAEGQFEEEPRFRWQQHVTAASTTGVLEATVTITWPEGALTRRFAVTTYLLDPSQTTANGDSTSGGGQ
jgi:prepilin-type N-terminal cleavage/methylation domain-containing protein